MIETRAYGPPGTGKTTWVTAQVRRDIERYGDRGVVALTFTRSAAREMRGRVAPSYKGKTEGEGEGIFPLISTLHSAAKRALGDVKVLGEDDIEEWNKTYPYWRVAQTKANDTPEGGGVKPEDAAGLYDLLRARLTPRSVWPQHILGFAGKWEDYKRERGVLDFTDMLERALADCDHAPGRPQSLILDEAQDCNPLMMRLIRKWAADCERFCMAGDDDQTLYSWSGADPAVMLDPALPDDQTRILSQSYRVPAAVLAYAERIIQRVRRRQPKVYAARKDEDGNTAQGEVVRLPGTRLYPAPLLDYAEGKLAEGKTVMVLAHSAYMLAPLLALARERGVPFANNHRPENGAWNPVRTVKGGTLPRFLAFVLGDLRGSALLSWLEVMQAEGVFQPGRKAKAIEYFAGMGDRPHVLTDLDLNFITEAAANAWWERDAVWFADYIEKPRRNAAAYLRRVYEKGGMNTLTETPRLRPGTGHSAKGLEAQVVIVMPDLSPVAFNEYRKDADPFHRWAYVMATRASESLVIASAADGRRYPL